MRMRKRSSCDSGSGKVPTWCEGFCVAMTKKGSGSGRVSPSIGDLVLFHRLQQRALRLGRGAVDFVRQDQLREHRPGMELEGAAVAVEHRYADDVGRQQIAGELHALEAQTEQLARVWASVVLPTPGRSSISRWPARQQAGHGQPYLPFLAEDDSAGGGDNVV